MNTAAKNRAKELGVYIADNGVTVRAAAKTFGVSKSTVHTDVTQRLKSIDPGLWEQVRQVLDENKAQRHIRGGNATREKYKKAKEHSLGTV